MQPFLVQKSETIRHCEIIMVRWGETMGWWALEQISWFAAADEIISRIESSFVASKSKLTNWRSVEEILNEAKKSLFLTYSF